MIPIGWVYLASGCALVAIIINLASKFDARTWITRDLRRGDLYALVEVASLLNSRVQAKTSLRVCGKIL